eukprot:363520-Chlamydomonas_euryale.AAC.11
MAAGHPTARVSPTAQTLSGSSWGGWRKPTRHTLPIRGTDAGRGRGCGQGGAGLLRHKVRLQPGGFERVSRMPGKTDFNGFRVSRMQGKRDFTVSGFQACGGKTGSRMPDPSPPPTPAQSNSLPPLTKSAPA